MAKAAPEVACFLISFLLLCNGLFAQTSSSSAIDHSLPIIPIKSIAALVIKTDFRSQLTVVKRCDFKTVKAQYAQVLKVKPDAEMVQLTKEQQEQADLEAEKEVKTKQNNIIKASQQLAEKFELTNLTFADLQKVTPSASGKDITVTASAQPVIPAINNQGKENTTLSYTKTDFSQPIASVTDITNTGSTSVSIRRTSGLLQNKSRLEQKYILSYKVHENEGD